MRRSYTRFGCCQEKILFVVIVCLINRLQLEPRGQFKSGLSKSQSRALRKSLERRGPGEYSTVG